MAHCPAYRGPICSLCCTLDARCDDLCKPEARLAAQWSATLRWLLPRARVALPGHRPRPLPAADAGGAAAGCSAALPQSCGARAAAVLGPRYDGFVKVYAVLLLVAGIVAWWLVLAHKSRQVAQEESNRQTHAADAARSTRTAAPTRSCSRPSARPSRPTRRRRATSPTISHELRTPLNSILGYAQLLEEDASTPPAHARRPCA